MLLIEGYTQSISYNIIHVLTFTFTNPKVIFYLGYNIEWHIVVLESFMFKFPLNIKEKYINLAHATGGSCIILSDNFSQPNYNQTQVKSFLQILEASTNNQNDIIEKRKTDYLLKSKKGESEKFDWLPLLPKQSNNDTNK